MKKKRKIKKLTAIRWAEFLIIRKRIDVLKVIFNQNRRAYYDLAQKQYGLETNIHKVNLENMFDDTDSRQQKMKILEILIDLEYLISEGKSEDKGRYAKMGLRLSPNAAQFNFRNGISVHFI